MNSPALGVLRILEFRTARDDSKIDELLDEIAPHPTNVEGLLWTLIGRRVSDRSREYVIATVWVDDAAMRAAIEFGGTAVYQPSFAAYLGDAVVDAGPLDISVWTCDVSFFLVDRAPEGSENVQEEDPPCVRLAMSNGVGRVLIDGLCQPAQPGTRAEEGSNGSGTVYETLASWRRATNHDVEM